MEIDTLILELFSHCIFHQGDHKFSFSRTHPGLILIPKLPEMSGFGLCSSSAVKLLPKVKIEKMFDQQYAGIVQSKENGQSNANMYTYCIMFEDCREQVNRKTKPKPRHFRLFRNPGQDMSRKKRTYNHPTFISTHIYARKQNSTIILDSLEQICIHCHNNDKPCVTYLEGRLKENKD